MNTEEMLEALTKAASLLDAYRQIIITCNLYSANQISAEVAMHEIKTTIIKESN